MDGIYTADPEKDPLQVRWVLQAEPLALGEGGDAEEVPPTFPEAIVKSDERSAEVKLPPGGGGYRLFAYVTDNHGGAAVGNLPLFVNGPVNVTPAKIAKLPLVISDEDDQADAPFAASGWMGNTKGLKLTKDCQEQPHHGETCLKLEYAPADGWAGIVWQSPANDWGDRPGGWNLTGARRLVFQARGQRGDEVVSFSFGVLGKDKKFPDSATAKLETQKLTTEWKTYTIDLTGLDLSRIKTGFSFSLAGQGKPVVFYLDEVRFE